MSLRTLLTSMLFALSAIMATAAVALAASQVTPVRVFVDVKGRGVITITNVGDQETLYKVTAYDWQQTDGKDVLTPTREFIASPPSFTLKPRQKRDIRIGFRSSKRLAAERTYRLSIQEIPSKVEVDGATLALSVSVNHLLPVFVAAADNKAAAEPRWSARFDKGDLVIRCENQGQSHYSFQKIALGKSSKSKNQPAFSVNLNATVLPGAWQEWRVKVPSEISRKQLSTIQVGLPRKKELTAYPLDMK